MTSQSTLMGMIVELLDAYPIDPSERLLCAALCMEFGVEPPKSTLRGAIEHLARAGVVDVRRSGGTRRYGLSA